MGKVKGLYAKMMQVEEYAVALLKSWGFEVERIQATETRTPDFLVRDSKYSYLIELKSREDDQQELEDRELALRKGEGYTSVKTTGRHRRVKEKIEDAAVQLHAGGMEADFYLVWLIAVGDRRKLKAEQFFATLYGSVTMVDMGDESKEAVPCYYFKSSEFYTLREKIDGAIVTFDDRGRFCLNTYSPRYAVLRETPLAKALNDSPCDPLKEERRGEAYIADTEIDRKKEMQVREYVQSKYGRPRLMNFTMREFASEIRVQHLIDRVKCKDGRSEAG